MLLLSAGGLSSSFAIELKRVSFAKLTVDNEDVDDNKHQSFGLMDLKQVSNIVVEEEGDKEVSCFLGQQQASKLTNLFSSLA